VTLLARVEETRHGDVVVAAVEGEIDASNTAEIAQLLRSALSNRSMALVVDLSPTRYLDSAGINLLFELGADLGERQQRLHLVVPPGAPIARAISITGLDAAVATHPDVKTALRAAG
jgi:anti-anti-sigma factor